MSKFHTIERLRWGNPSLVRMSLLGTASLSAARWRHGRAAADGRFHSQLLPLLLPLGVGGAGTRPLIEPLLKLGTLTCIASQSDVQPLFEEWSACSDASTL